MEVLEISQESEKDIAIKNIRRLCDAFKHKFHCSYTSAGALCDSYKIRNTIKVGDMEILTMQFWIDKGFHNQSGKADIKINGLKRGYKIPNHNYSDRNMDKFIGKIEKWYAELYDWIKLAYDKGVFNDETAKYIPYILKLDEKMPVLEEKTEEKKALRTLSGDYKDKFIIDKELLSRIESASFGWSNQDFRQDEINGYLNKILSFGLPIKKEEELLNKAFKMFVDALQARANYMPVAVCGPARYNYAREEKKYDTYMRKMQAFSEFMEKLESGINESTTNNLNMILENEYLKVYYADIQAGRRIALEFKSRPKQQLIFALKSRKYHWNAYIKAWTLRECNFDIEFIKSLTDESGKYYKYL